jgi:ADP-dependent NAD(P)H-hydrate dehydratase / NAD(P)H-hydrate epimerase
MRLLTAEQMQKVDAETIDRVCPGLELMERAGRGVAKAILARHAKPGKAVIFVGPGNNGGDGLVVARLLVEAGWQCSIHLLKTTELTADTAKNYQRLNKKNLHEFDASRSDWAKGAQEDVTDATVIVDAIFGTGAKGAPRGRAAEMIALINSMAVRKVPVVSIDIPSGVDGTSGDVPGKAVCATETITIGAPKTGLLFYPGKEHVGALSIIDIGFPNEIVEKHANAWFYLDEDEAAKKLPRRAPDIHKYEAGRLLLIAGSDAYRGAALLAAEAALRGGCGMVYLAVPEGIRAEVSVALREAVTIALPQTAAGTIARDAARVLEEYRDKVDAIAIGPGLGRNDETDAFVREFVARTTRPTILDADGLMAFPGHADELARANAPIVITPHGGELKRLVGKTEAGSAVGYVVETTEIAQRLGVTLVRKGAPTVIASGGSVWINSSGSSALATVGTGDVLAGLLGSLLAQGASPGDASCVACFLHGRAGELAAVEKGVRGVIAGDLMPLLGPAMRSLEARAA